MEILNNNIDIEPQKFKWVYDHFTAQKITIDNSFQRNYVWLPKHQIKLIETILIGFPIPEIYLWHTKTDHKNGDMWFSIIDGQQRIGAIVDYINGDYELETKYLEKENINTGFAGKKFDILPPQFKNAIWKYKLSIRLVADSVSRDRIVEMFLRLNSTNMTLNPQELRNAKFDGEFIELCAELAENEFWEENKLFSIADIRRMQDIQFISTILMFLRHGISEDTNQENINKTYDLFNEAYQERESDKDIFEQLISLVKKVINDDKAVSKFLKKKTHLYTLFLVAYKYLQTKGDIPKTAIENYKKFVDNYNDEEAIISNYSQDLATKILEYKRLSSTGTQGKSNRISRNNIIEEVMEN